MSCIKCVSLDELEEEEIGFLVQMLSVKGTDIAQESLLSAVLRQLISLSDADGSKASDVFKSTFTESAVGY